MSEYTLPEMLNVLREFVDYAESVVPFPLPKLRAILTHLKSEQSRIDAAVEAEFDGCCEALCDACEYGIPLLPRVTDGDGNYWYHKRSVNLPDGNVYECGAWVIRERRYQEKLSKQPERGT